VIRTLGRYQLLEQVGSGGMAVVYRGRDSALEREVAVKLLHPHLAQAAESRARFSREARAVARLAHPGIVEIYDYSGDGAPEAYLVTEFIRGQTLRDFAQDTGFSNPEVGLLIGRALAGRAAGSGARQRESRAASRPETRAEAARGSSKSPVMARRSVAVGLEAAKGRWPVASQ